VSTIRRIRLVAFDFDGVFTDNTVYVSEDGHESVRCWRGDGLGLRDLERLGITTVVISTETNAVVQHRSRKLALRCFSGCENKLSILREVTREMGISLGEVAFVGNDVNDLECLSVVGLPVIVSDAHPSVRHVASYRTKAAGGYGAVREICDLFAAILSP
jgi:3-deoxy-D-manno-octulosonate 8-phosphate phosphatase (KDO 8-P phosphatase)